MNDLPTFFKGIVKAIDSTATSLLKGIRNTTYKVDPQLPDTLGVELRGVEVVTLKGDKGEKGDKGDRGDKGDQGKDGKTGSTGSKGEKGDAGRDGVDGFPGIDGKDGDQGKDGQDGQDGKDGSPNTPEQIRSKLEGLEGSERLSVQAIDGMDDAFENIQQGIVSYIPKTFDHLLDAPNSYSGQSGKYLRVKTGENGLEFAENSASGVASIEFVIDGGGSVITTGIKGDLNIDFACTIQSWTLLADQSGSAVVDVWKDNFASFPPVSGDSITGSSIPTLSSQTSATSSTLTGWTTTISAGDVLRFNVNSIATIQRLTLSLKVTKN